METQREIKVKVKKKREKRRETVANRREDSSLRVELKVNWIGSRGSWRWKRFAVGGVFAAGHGPTTTPLLHAARSRIGRGSMRRVPFRAFSRLLEQDTTPWNRFFFLSFFSCFFSLDRWIARRRARALVSFLPPFPVTRRLFTGWPRLFGQRGGRELLLGTRLRQGGGERLNANWMVRFVGESLGFRSRRQSHQAETHWNLFNTETTGDQNMGFPSETLETKEVEKHRICRNVRASIYTFCGRSFESLKIHTVTSMKFLVKISNRSFCACKEKANFSWESKLETLSDVLSVLFDYISLFCRQFSPFNSKKCVSFLTKDSFKIRFNMLISDEI